MWPQAKLANKPTLSQVEGPGGRKDNVKPLVPQASVKGLER